MKTLAVIVALPVLLLACNSSDTVKEAKKLRDRMCKCKDMKCAAVVQKDQVKWLADKGKNAGKRDKVELTPVMLKYKECWDAIVEKSKKDVKDVGK